MRFSRLSPPLIASILLGLAAVVAGILLATNTPPWVVLRKIGTPERTMDFVRIYEWWAGAINLGLLILLALTSRWWLRPFPASSSWLPEAATPRWFWPLVLAAMALTAFWGLQRLPLSLWDDEDTSLRRAILGEYRRDAEGNVKLREIGWTATFWNYWQPTNHHLQSVLSKACLECWRAVARPQGLQFSEPVVRLPCYLAGILSVGAIALLLKRIGFPRAAVVAAFLLALHPWHVRYAVEQRGYVFTLLCGPFMLYALLQAVESGRWRWWLAFACAEFALLYAYPGCLYFVLFANLCGLAMLGLRHRQRDARITQGLRFLAANLAMSIVYIQLMLPCVPQLLNYLKTARALGELGERWHRNMASHLFSGIPWNNSDAPGGGYPELRWIAEAHPALFRIAAAIALLCLLLGMCRMIAKKPAGALLAACLLAPGCLVYAVSRANHNYLYEWYLIFTLPGLVAFAALGADACAGAAQRLHRFAGPGLLALLLLFAAWATQAPRQWLLTHSIQPMRESVELTRPTLDPYDPRQKEIITVAIASAARSYDANIRGGAKMSDFVAALHEADATGKTLYVNYGNGWAAAVDSPDVHRMIEDDRLFEKIATLPGFDPTLTRFVRRYKPGTITSHPVPN